MEWIEFVPSKDYIGLRARFRKVIGNEVEEVVGTIVADPCHNPWQYDVEIICDDDKRRLPFPNGACPFYDDKDGERHYFATFDVKYYYSPEDKPLCREGYSAMVIDELTTMRNGRLERVCRSGGNPMLKPEQSLICSSTMQAISSKELEKGLQGYWLINSSEKMND